MCKILKRQTVCSPESKHKSHSNHNYPLTKRKLKQSTGRCPRPSKVETVLAWHFCKFFSEPSWNIGEIKWELHWKVPWSISCSKTAEFRLEYHAWTLADNFNAPLTGTKAPKCPSTIFLILLSSNRHDHAVSMWRLISSVERKYRRDDMQILSTQARGRTVLAQNVSLW